MNRFNTTLLGIALLLITPAAQAQSPMFRGDLAHTGVYRDSGVTVLRGVKWRFRTGGLVISTPALAGGAAFVGSTDGNLYAIASATGAEKWKFATGARIASSPAIAGGLVYFESYDGYFYALEAATGKLAWKFQTAGERRFAGRHLHGWLPEGEIMPDPFDLYLSSPAVSGDLVYFGSGDGNVYALEAGSGKLRWRFKTGDVVHASPAIALGTVFIGSWDSYFYALDAATGRLRWRFKTGEDPEIHNQVGIQSSATVADGVVYFGCRDANLYAVDARTGKQRWAYSTAGAWVITSPTVHQGRVYFGTGDTRTLLALDAKTGAKLLERQFSWYFFGSPAIAGNLIYAPNWDGKLTALDLATFQPAWVFQTDASRQHLAEFTKPDGSMNFMAAVQERFYDDRPGALLRIFTMGSLLTSPVVADRVVYVGSTDGYLYALN